MPQVFNPGHRPSSPLEPDELVYCTVDEVAEFLQLPLPDPISLSADSYITDGVIYLPVSGAEYRRWKFDTTTKITVYDDADAMGKSYTVSGTESIGSGNVAVKATAVASESFTTAANAQIQINHALTNSQERGLTRSHVENLIRKKQDYIDQVCRMAWRPRIVVDEYQNFTTFKPYRRRYYTDYVGAVYLRHRSLQRILRLGVWQSDYYRELGAARTCMKVGESTQLAGTEKIFLCNGTPHTATLQSGTGNGQWQSDFGSKTIAQNIANLINKDSATSRTAIAIGTLEEYGKQLNVNNEFLAAANSDEGDGKVVISSMRSTEEGESNTIATTNPDVFIFSLGTGVQSSVESVSGGGTNFTLKDGSPFTKTQGLVYFTVGGTTHVARCSRSGNDFTVVEELTTGAKAALATDVDVKQQRLNVDMNDEERQYDWWSMEDNGAIMFNNQYPFYENHSLKVSYIYGERYLDKTIKEVCIKMVAIDIMMTDDYTVLFPEGSQNVDLNSKIQKMEEEVKRMLVPYQETIIVAGMGG